LRKQSETIKEETLKELYSELKTYQKIFSQLKEQKLFEQAKSIDSAKVLEAALND